MTISLTKGSCTVPNDDARMTELLDALAQLDTEASTTERGDLDLLETAELVRRMNAEDRLVPEAVGRSEARPPFEKRIICRWYRPVLIEKTGL